MLRSRCLSLSALLFLTAACLSARMANQSSPVPADPLELATGSVTVADTPDARTAAIGLLERARQNYKLRTPGSAPYHLQVFFNASGGTAYSGAEERDETWLSEGVSGWSAQLGSYSESRVFHGGMGYDANPAAYLPLRLQMLRSAIYWPVLGNFANRSLRVAPATWMGNSVTCIFGRWRTGAAHLHTGTAVERGGILHRSEDRPIANLLGRAGDL